MTRQLRCPTSAEPKGKQEALILPGFVSFGCVDGTSFRFCTSLHWNAHNARPSMQYVCDYDVMRFSLLRPQVITPFEDFMTVTGLFEVMHAVHAQHSSQLLRL
jgi:hypothetical protein